MSVNKSRIAGGPLTDNQRRQLIALKVAGAVSRKTAARVTALTFGNVMVIGALRDRSLAASRSVQRLGTRWTEYWLTPAGLAAAERLGEVQHG